MKTLIVALTLVVAGCGSADNDPQIDCAAARDAGGAIAATIAAACDLATDTRTEQHYAPKPD